MSECEFWSDDHCMVLAESGITETYQPVCCDATGGGQHFSDLYRFNPTNTSRHQCCFIAVWHTAAEGCGEDARREGRHCGYGCQMCDDLQLDSMTEYLDGQRWMRAEKRIGQRFWDARGLIHDLRSNEYHPIPGKITYERGSCWYNNQNPESDGGEECFQEDACACFGVNSLYPGIAGSTPGDEPPWNCSASEPAPGILPDPFFRTGYRWPPTTMPGAVGSNSQGMEKLYCRKFPDTRLPFNAGGGHGFTKVLISPTQSGGLSGMTEPMFDPVLMSSTTCNSDRMVGCTARMATNSDCYGHSAWGEFVERWGELNPGIDPDPASAFYNDNSASRNRFSLLSIDSENTAYIRAADNSEGLGGPTAKWKNAVLEAIKTEQFWTAEEHVEPGGPPSTSMNFAQLDHLHPLQEGGNTYVGVYRREWGGDRIFPMPVPNGSGTGRLRMSGCLFDYETFLTHVKIECRLILQQVKEWGEEYQIEPLIRLHIIGVVSVVVSNLRSALTERGIAGPCYVDSWELEPVPQPGFIDTRRITERDIPLRGIPAFDDSALVFQHPRIYLGAYNRLANYGTVPEIWATPRPRDWPETNGRLDPPVGEPWGQPESFVFLDGEGKQFIPNRLVEWRGFLGEHSRPKASEQRGRMERGPSGCNVVADKFNAWGGTVVPGWPTHADSEPDDPNQVYGGHVLLNFVL